jgi:hypothetical protein
MRISELFGTLGIFALRELSGIYVHPFRPWSEWQ